MTRTVRTTMTPHESIVVDETEYLDLRRQGLLVEDVEPDGTTDRRTRGPARGGVKE
jgi:hypothetical protein